LNRGQRKNSASRVLALSLCGGSYKMAAQELDMQQ
jgi:hypothetical protein